MVQTPPGIDRRLEAERLPTGWPWQFLLFSLFLFLASVLIYFGLSGGYAAFLKNEIKKTDSRMEELGLRVTVEEQTEFINFYSQLKNLRSLLQSHAGISRIFDFLEKNSVAKVSISSVDFSVADRSVTIDASADSFAVLAAQISSYEKSDLVERVSLDNSRSSGALAQFTATLVLKPELFLAQ